jgi:hypothetical protein
MGFLRVAFVSAAVVAGVFVGGCTQDTPKSVFQDSDEYANRVFVPSVLKGSVHDLVVSKDGQPLPFNKITYTLSANVMTGGAVISHRTDFTLENAGNAFTREILVFHRNGVESGREVGLTYRGLVWLYELQIQPNYKQLPYPHEVESISHLDSSFDQPTLNYAYRMGSDARNVKTVDRSIACTFVKTYAASKISAGIQGDAREYACNFFNDNGVQDAQKNFAYLEKYGVVFETHVSQVNENIDWVITDFKVE